MIQILGRVLVSNSIAQVLTSNVLTAINFDLELADNADAHDTINNTRITINHNYFNLIRFRARANFAFAANTTYLISIRKNGAAIVPAVVFSGNSAADGLSVMSLPLESYWIPCVLGDFFELFANQSSIGNLNFNINGWLEAELGYN